VHIAGDTAALGGEVLLVKIQVIHCFFYVEVCLGFVEFFYFSIVAKLTDEFASLEEPTDDYVILTIAVCPTNGSDFVDSEKRVEPK
jgi:hypothetical protein